MKRKRETLEDVIRMAVRVSTRLYEQDGVLLSFGINFGPGGKAKIEKKRPAVGKTP